MSNQDNPSENLWPDLQQLSRYTDVPPKEILQQQAKFFGQQTNHLLEAVVRPSSMDKDTGKLYLNFFIRAPIMPNVQIKLFWVCHNLTLYPTDVMLNNTKYRECSSSVELKTALYALFREETVLQKISNLLAQADTSNFVDDADTDA